MSWIFLTILVFPVTIFILYLLKDLIRVASRTSVKVHKRPVAEPTYNYREKRNLYIAK